MKATHTKNNLIQGNEYYPFGLQTANSWTRENATGNNFLANGGTELNTTTSVYDLDYRNYDPVLGRMNQVDPLADKYSGLSSYNYSFNNPIVFSDPDGAESRPSVADYFADVQASLAELYPWGNAQDGGGGQSSFGGYAFGGSSWYGFRGGSIGNNAGGYVPGYVSDAQAVRNGTMTHGEYAERNGTTLYRSTQLFNPWGGAQAGPDKYEGEWVEYNESLSKKIASKGYAVKTSTEMRFLSALESTRGNRSENFHFYPEEVEFWAYKQMLNDQRFSDKEILGYYVTDKETGKRGILVLPWAGNDRYSSRPYIGMDFGSKTITDFDGNIFTPFKAIHTHPDNVTPSGEYGDIGGLRELNRYFPGITGVILNDVSYNVYNSSGRSLDHGGNWGLLNGRQTFFPNR